MITDMFFYEKVLKTICSLHQGLHVKVNEAVAF